MLLTYGNNETKHGFLAYIIGDIVSKLDQRA